MDPKTTNPETIDPKINACRKLINVTDSLLREEISSHMWFEALSQDLYILRVIARAYSTSVDLKKEYRFPAVIMYLFAHCGAPEIGVRAIKHLNPAIPILFYIEILDKRKELCPSTEVYTVMTHDGNLITRTSGGDELVDLDPICIHASAVAPPNATDRRVVYVPNKFGYQELYSWV